MRIAPGATIALDTDVLVYFLERHETYFQSVAALIGRIEKGEITAVISSLVYAELLVPAYRAGESGVAARTFHHLTRFPNLRTVEVSAAIAQNAARLRAEYGLRTPDALHAATALDRNADLLLTDDSHFRRIEKELRICRIDALLNA
jgi:predicted nucleic acid-binding protein